MWFTNLTILQFEKQPDFTAETLHESLSTKAFTPCSATQRTSLGWGHPVSSGESFTHASAGAILITMMKQEKLLPSAVIKDTLQETVEAIESQEKRKVSAREKRELREDIEHQLLPRAFTRTKRIDGWIDVKKGYLAINTASSSIAEDFTKLLRKTLGSLPVSLLETATSPAVGMTQWLSSQKTPKPFTLGYECELKNHGDDKGTAIFRSHDLSLEEVQTSLQAGKYVTSLALEWDEKISFVLTENMQIKKLKFLDVLEEKINDQDPQDHAEHLDISFTLMHGEVGQMLLNLVGALNGRPS